MLRFFHVSDFFKERRCALAETYIVRIEGRPLSLLQKQQDCTGLSLEKVLRLALGTLNACLIAKSRGDIIFCGKLNEMGLLIPSGEIILPGKLAAPYAGK